MNLFTLSLDLLVLWKMSREDESDLYYGKSTVQT